MKIKKKILKKKNIKKKNEELKTERKLERKKRIRERAKKTKKKEKEKVRKYRVVPTYVSERIEKVEKIKRVSKQKPAKNLIKTGIKNLDIALGGGIPIGSMVLVGGVPHTGKKPLLMKLAHTNRKKGIIFIITDFGVNSWTKMGENSNLNLRENVYYIDCFSKQYPSSPPMEGVIYIEYPYTLTDISIKLEDLLSELKSKGMTPIVIFHSLSTLIQNFGGIETYKFLQFLVGRLRSEGITAIFSVQFTDERIARDMEGLADYVIEMRDGKLKVSGFKTINDWISYKITKKGIECFLE
jgi:KaiC/GvpD/RAD55 family RecA-like ATPase